KATGLYHELNQNLHSKQHEETLASGIYRKLIYLRRNGKQHHAQFRFLIVRVPIHAPSSDNKPAIQRAVFVQFSMLPY
ncbi:hypothetical protein COX84_00390, partial [Candidatus Micrarchaeota archaeon CG_4_10_14_0_2_um_filter_49_7]